MAKEKKSTDADTTGTEETKSTSTTKKAAPEARYVGPRYVNGLTLPDGKTVKPAEFSQAEIKKFIKRYPAFERWFENSAS